MKGKETVPSLHVNGLLVTTSSDTASSFFLQSKATKLTLTTVAPNGRKRVLKTITLPSIRFTKFLSGNEGEIAVTSDVQTIGLDNLKLRPVGGSSRFPIEIGENWFRGIHIVELVTRSGIKRRYNLRFTPREIAEAPPEAPAESEASERKPAEASSEVTVATPQTDQWNQFASGFTWFRQKYGGSGVYPYVAWLPSGPLTEGLDWEVELQLIPIKKRDAGYTAVAGAALGPSFRLLDLRMSVGGGAQAWIGHGGVRPTAHLRLSTELDSVNLPGALLRLGYLAVFDENFTHEILAGMSFQL